MILEELEIAPIEGPAYIHDVRIWVEHIKSQQAKRNNIGIARQIIVARGTERELAWDMAHELRQKDHGHGMSWRSEESVFRTQSDPRLIAERREDGAGIKTLSRALHLKHKHKYEERRAHKHEKHAERLSAKRHEKFVDSLKRERNERDTPAAHGWN